MDLHSLRLAIVDEQIATHMQGIIVYVVYSHFVDIRVLLSLQVKCHQECEYQEWSTVGYFHY